MRELLNAMQLQSKLAINGKHFTRLGTVTSYNPNKYAIKAAIEPEGIQSGWMPIGSEWVGNGWGLFCPPSIGDLVVITFQEGDIEAPIVSKRLYTKTNLPLAVQSGEFWLVHQSGSYMKLMNNGQISLHSASNVNVGNVNTTLHNLVTDAFMSLFNSHTHGGGAVPDQSMSSSHLTSSLKGN